MFSDSQNLSVFLSQYGNPILELRLELPVILAHFKNTKKEKKLEQTSVFSLYNLECIKYVSGETKRKKKMLVLIHSIKFMLLLINFSYIKIMTQKL